MSVPECAFCNPADTGRLIRVCGPVASLLSDPRRRPGHVLVVPLRHVMRLSELRPDEMAAMMAELVRLERCIVDSSHASGFDIVQKYEPTRPQGPTASGGHKMDHLHVHGLPRFYFDPVSILGSGTMSPLSEDELRHMHQLYQAKVPKRPAG